MKKRINPKVYDLRWTNHAKERAFERFKLTEFPDTIDLTSPYILFNNYRSKDGSYVYKVINGSLTYYLALKQDKNTIVVITVKEDASKALAFIKNLF